jgi:hypothetical protein
MNTKFNQLSKHLLVVLLTVVVASALAQPPTPSNPLPPQGLLSRLIEIKYSSELYVETKLKSETLTAAQKDTALATYNTLRWKVDGFVYQLSSEMIARNSPRAWRKLNEWCLQGKDDAQQLKKLQNLQDFNEIENFYATKIKPFVIPVTKTLNLTTNVFYLLKDSYTIIKGMSDLKTQKTMALIELMDHTRLMSVGELRKGVK